MTAGNDSVLIEISEDAYKQNSVYRPWSEGRRDESVATETTTHTSHKLLAKGAIGRQRLGTSSDQH